MRKSVTAVPKGESLCLFCASWLAAKQPRALRSASRRQLHTRNGLRQASQTASKPQTQTQTQDTEGWGQAKDKKEGDEAGSWGSGGWGGCDSATIWGTSTKVLGKKDDVKPPPSERSGPGPRAATQPRSQPNSYRPAVQARAQEDDEPRQGGFHFRKQAVGSSPPPDGPSQRTPLQIDRPAPRQEGRRQDSRHEGSYTFSPQQQPPAQANQRPQNDSLLNRSLPSRQLDTGSKRLDLGASSDNQASPRPEQDSAATQRTWPHLRYIGGTKTMPPPSPPAINPAVQKLREEQQTRMQRARQGLVAGWSDDGKVDWRTSGQQDQSNKTAEESTAASPWAAEIAIRRISTDKSLRDDRQEAPREGPQRDERQTLVAETNSSRDQGQERMRRKDARALPRSNTGVSRAKARRATARDDDEDEGLSELTLARMARREKRKAEREQKKLEAGPTPITLPNFISIGNLAAALHVRSELFAQKLEELGFEGYSNDHIISGEDAGLIAQELNFEPTIATTEDVREDLVAAPEPAQEDKDYMLNRPPVITIMGHVDHGKTTLLDYLRKSSVAAGEHGGITQHIGAFTVEMSSGRTITFLDTPGHSAFLEMRQRGANVTDIVILVVAADDSVKPQTLEAIKHAKGADVPIIVAISKSDKDEANPDRVKRDLAQHGVEVEDFGGDVQAIPVSGKTGQGMEDLEDAAIALADILDVRADTAGKIEGWVLESKLKPQGRVATVLIKRGTLRPGAILVAGTTWTKVRTLRNEAGQEISEATPGQPVEVDGWDETPEAGAEALEAPNMQRARDVCELREDRREAERLAASVAATNEQRVEHRAQRAIIKEQAQLAKSGNEDEARSAELEAAAELAKANANSKFIRAPIIVRADVAGSAEAVSAAIQAMGNSEIRAHVLREEVGQISESDVELAATAHGIIVNFGLTIPNEMRRTAEQKSVRIIDGNVIYRITDSVKEYLEDKLPPLITQRVLGEAEIAQVFEYKIKGRGSVPVAGCKITNGIVEKGKNVKIFRAGEVVYDGILSSLKNHKRDVDTMQKGTECGMGFEKFTAFETGDKIQAYEVLEEKRKL